jgi:glutathione peroxidase-family protein
MCHLQELYTKYKSKGLVVLGFDASDDKKIALQLLRENGATFPNILDSSDAAQKVCFE